jgi:fructose transport system substrate-binding protein
MTKVRLLALSISSIAAFSGSGVAMADDIIVGLITKSYASPFFVKMKEGAAAKAEELGVELRDYAGKDFNDNESQVAAIESLISGGAKGFAIVAVDSRAIVPSIRKAREAGLFVIALDPRSIRSTRPTRLSLPTTSRLAS